MRKTTLLKKLINDPEILIMPGVYDALSAKVAQKCGAKAVQVSGYGVAGSYLGMPDVGILTLTQMVDITRHICNAVDIPVMADGDTGFGNAVNLYYTVKEIEAAGAAGVNLEDQVFPKRCGHMEGKQIISIEKAVKKIEAAVAAKVDPDFVINARTDAIAVAGIDEAIKRGNAFAKAGADLIFVEAPNNPDEIKRVIQSIDAPVSINMLYGGKTPPVPIKTLEEWGAARVSVPVASIFAVTKALDEAFTKILDDEGMELLNHSYNFKQFTALVGLPQIRDLENKYLDSSEWDARYQNQQI